MSKKNETPKTNEVKNETKSFEDMKKMVSEFNKMKKLIKEETKSLSKDQKKELGIGEREKREFPELNDMVEKIFQAVNLNKSAIRNIFDKSVTLEKPDGNKSISLSFENEKDYIVAIIKRKVKKQTD